MTRSMSTIGADSTYADLCARTDGAPAGSSWGVFDNRDRGTANFAGIKPMVWEMVPSGATRRRWQCLYISWRLRGVVIFS